MLCVPRVATLLRTFRNVTVPDTVGGDATKDINVNLAAVLEMVGRTDAGLQRGRNEDAIFCDAGAGIAILADGMGGYNAGEVASSMATTQLAEELVRIVGLNDARRASLDAALVEQHLINEVGAANFAIFSASQNIPRYAGMGTTLVLTWFYDNRLSVAHVGDSRLYRLRGTRFEQLTRDHSLLQEQMDQGVITPEQARLAEYKNLVTRALGVDPGVDVEISDYDVRVGDILLLCSDGLNDMIEDQEISLTLQALGGNLPLAADHLIQMANDNGGRDNVSVVLVGVRGNFSMHKGWWHSLMARMR